ncbi:MAG: lytic transglycosylase domain-containing protein [Bacteroidia bacterium]
MNSKAIYFILPLLILVSGFSLMNRQSPPAAMELQRFGSKLQVMTMEAPAFVEFAGERIPTERPDVKAKLDKELQRYSRGLAGSKLLMKRMGRYQKAFTSALADYGVPADFFYLSMIESNLSNAISPAGAAGFWQLMPETAKQYGLEVSNEVDERLHVEKATIAAGRYLRDLHKNFGSWTLVAAAYNRGEAGLQRALTKQNVEDYFSLHLNRETAQYVYRAAALKLLATNPERYGLEAPRRYSPLRTYAVELSENIENLPLYIIDNKIDPVAFRQLNPWILQDFLNVPSGKNYTIQLPMGRLSAPELAIEDRYFRIALDS